MKLRNLKGQTFGKLRVLEQVQERTKNGKVQWLCACECGGRTIVMANSLLTNRTVSCGCYGRSFKGESSPVFLHGRRKSAEYRSWCAMKTRCSNPKAPQYKDYGGRGIKVYPQWQKSFATFFKDMGPKPTTKHSIDRKNVDGNYTPRNCRWATSSEQARNKRKRILA